MVYQIERLFVAQRDEPIYRVIENFVAAEGAHSNTKSPVSTLLCRLTRILARDAARYKSSRRSEKSLVLECELKWEDHTFFGLMMR